MTVRAASLVVVSQELGGNLLMHRDSQPVGTSAVFEFLNSAIRGLQEAFC